jgi:hypothetical protein
MEYNVNKLFYNNHVNENLIYVKHIYINLEKEKEKDKFKNIFFIR